MTRVVQWIFMGIILSQTLTAYAQNPVVYLELELHGLVCSLCSNSVERSIRKLPFIQTVETDLESAIANIAAKDSDDLSFYAIAKAVEKAGFSVGKFVVYYRLNEDQKEVQFGQERVAFIDDKHTSGAAIIQLVEKPFVSSKEWKTWRTKLTSNAEDHKIRAIVL